MLATLKEVLEKAEQGNYAVGAFNCTSLESGMAIVETAEELNSPVILQYADSPQTSDFYRCYWTDYVTACKNSESTSRSTFGSWRKY